MKGMINMAKTEPRTLSGFMELLPNEQILFNQMRETIEDTYKKFGFLPLDTPVIELSEVLLAKAGGETEKQIYRFNKGDKDLSLRFDLTVPLSKYVAKNYGNLSFPFRRYQIGKVYRGERTQKGRFREFYQCDIDVIGDGELDLINDAELPSVIYTIFKNLGFNNFTIRVNNRKILNGLFEEIGQEEKSVEVLEKIYPEKGREYAEKIRDYTIALYKKCAEYALTKGIIIADTKFEFGLNEQGEVVLADEMLTPDSSRFWPLDGYKPGQGQPSFDKQYVRDWLKANPDNDLLLPDEVVVKTVEKYKEAFELLTGSKFSR